MSARLSVLALAGLSLGAAAPQPTSSLPAAPPPSEWTAACTANDDWDKGAPPFRIHGNAYYVGTCGVGSILITGSKGHVLIDGGTQKAGDLIAANIERLGFRLKDVKVLLYSHEHFDHVGGTARLQQLTGARLYAVREAAKVLNTGHDQPGDPQVGLHPPFPAARVDRLLGKDGRVVLGKLRLTGYRTPGHTPGALSWQWQSCNARGGDCRTIVYADSLNPISNDTYRFSDLPAYLAAFRRGLDKVASLKCDILITPHPVASRMHERLTAGTLEDTGACRAYVGAIRQRLEARLAKEAEARKP